jgi:multidrug efflux system membrane fusion protein
VTHAIKKSVPLDIQVIGTVEPERTVAVHAQITGALTEVRFREGDDVTAGQELFALDRRPLEAALAHAEATLAQAEATLARDVAQAANARAQSTRYQDLAQRGIATKEQVDQTRTAATALDATVDANRAAVEADRAAVENARIQLQYATIPAPISGRTGALIVHQGSLVRANDTTPLVTINQVAPISVTFGVPEARLTELKQYIARGGVVVSAQLPGSSDRVTGRISFIDNAVDRSTGLIKVKGTFANADRRLWPGQFVNVTVTLTTVPNAVTVPSVAVQVGPQGQFVYVVKPDQTADLRPVKVSRTHGDDSIVESGLTGEETVVTDGQIRLSPGSKVSFKTEAQPKAAP